MKNKRDSVKIFILEIFTLKYLLRIRYLKPHSQEIQQIALPEFSVCWQPIQDSGWFEQSFHADATSCQTWRVAGQATDFDVPAMSPTQRPLAKSVWPRQISGWWGFVSGQQNLTCFTLPLRKPA